MKQTDKQFWIWAIGVSLLSLISCGDQIDPKSKGYYENIKGIYFSPENNWFELGMNYINGVDAETFTVLDYSFAKDKNHVYIGANILKGADATSFYVDASGLPKDKLHVFVYDPEISKYRPARCRIDMKSAEMPFQKNNGQDWIWLRDKDNIYLREKRLNVDRNTFRSFGDWYIDKDKIYFVVWNSEAKTEELLTVDSIQTPIDTIPNSYYLRNGRNMIYLTKVILQNIDITTVRRLGIFDCIVNDMLLIDGKVSLKDTVDINTLQVVEEGVYYKDRNHVYYDDNILEGIDATSFRQTGDFSYEDKNGRYEIDHAARGVNRLKKVR